jgi:hypothetical protein
VTASWLFALVVAGDSFSRTLAPIDAGAPDQLRAAACVRCHPAAHADRSQSRHGLAWSNAIFQREYRDRPIEWCVHCHAPLVEQLAEVRQCGGPLADQGVNCADCHLRQGPIWRAHALASPPETDARPYFGGPGYCAACHQCTFPVVHANPGRPRPGTGHRLYGATDARHRQPERARPARR